YFIGSIQACIRLLHFTLSALTFDFTFAWLAIENGVATTVALVFSIIVLTRLRQVNSIVNRKTLSIARFYKFCHYHTETLVHIFAGNRFIGVMLFVILVFVAPMNTYLVNRLIMGKFNFRTSVLFWGACFFQYDCILALHLLSSKYTQMIHKCSHRLFFWIARRNRFPIRSKLHLLFYIEKFHVKKKYGITYGS